MTSRVRATLAVCAALASILSAASTPIRAQTPLSDELAAKFQRELETLGREASGVVGASVIDLTTGRRFDLNGTTVFPQGSAIKIALLVELLRQADAKELSLTERVTLTAKDRTGGSSLLQYFSDGGSAFSLHDLAVPMVVLSDNTATNMLIDRVGLDRVNAHMASLALPNTKLRRKMIRQDEQAKGNENISTPREAADLMARLSRCDVGLSTSSCAEVVRLLELPKGGRFRGAIPAAVPVAWKPGTLDGVSTAWGLVRLTGAPYAIAVMATYGGADADAVVGQISSAAFRYFSRLAGATDLGARINPQLLKKPGAK